MQSQWEKRQAAREQVEVDQLAAFGAPDPAEKTDSEKSKWEKRQAAREQVEIAQLAYFSKYQK